MTCQSHDPPLPFCHGCYRAHVLADPPLCDDANDMIEDTAEDAGACLFWGLSVGSDEGPFIAATFDWTEAMSWHAPQEGRYAVRLRATPQAR